MVDSIFVFSHILDTKTKKLIGNIVDTSRTSSQWNDLIEPVGFFFWISSVLCFLVFPAELVKFTRKASYSLLPGGCELTGPLSSRGHQERRKLKISTEILLKEVSKLYVYRRVKANSMRCITFICILEVFTTNLYWFWKFKNVNP